MNLNIIKQSIVNFGREEFADWLWRGLYDFYKSDKNSSFDNAGRIILQYDSIVEGLAVVYEKCVPEKNKLLFRQAIGDVLREHSASNSDMHLAFRDLIYLMVRINAFESLDSLLPAIGNGALGKLYSSLIYDAVATLTTLSPSMHAYKTTLQLIESQNFKDGYLWAAIKILVECKPEETAKYILQLEPRLSRLYQQAESIGGKELDRFCAVEENWVKFILSHAPVSWLKEFWEKSDHSPRQVWLLDTLFSNESVPVEFIWDSQTDNCYFNYRDNKIRIKTSKRDYHTRRMLLHNRVKSELDKWARNPDDEVNRSPVTATKAHDLHHEQTLGELISNKLTHMFSPKHTCHNNCGVSSL